MKMSVSPRRRAHFERSGHARPDQKGLAKPSQARPNFSGHGTEAKGGQKYAKGRPRLAKAKPRGGQGRPKGGQGEAKGAKREAKEQPKEAKGKPRGGQKRPREAKGGQTRPEGQTNPKRGRGLSFWVPKKGPFLKRKWSEKSRKRFLENERLA